MCGRFFVSSVCFISITFLINLCASIDLEQKQNHREGKVFSLFNIVKFENGGCESSEAGNSGNRNGTCYTSSECGDKGGMSKGSCAAGFGVCCLFLLNDPDVTKVVTQNCSYIQNKNYPTAITTATDGSQSYTINKCSDDVCYLRLDFEDFVLLGPSNSVETDTGTWAAANEDGGGTCDQDTFVITALSSSSYPTICGTNKGSHLYIDVGQEASQTATIDFKMKADGGQQLYDIKVTQIECGSTSAPPNGCLQYFTTVSGQFKTFNFDGPTTGTHLKEQDYQICFRKEKGYCCVQYNVCEESDYGDNNYTLYPDGTNAYNNAAAVSKYSESECTADYITIAGGAGVCSTNPALAGPTRDRFCGARLSVTTISKTHNPVCDCTPPFAVGIKTDAKNDPLNPDADEKRSRGLCLDFTQQPCN